MEDIDGGDTIYQPINLMPIGSSQQIIDNEKTLKFKEEVEKLKYKSGGNVYSLMG